MACLILRTVSITASSNRSSICTGEQVAGFKNIHTGHFEEVMLIRDDRDLDHFLELYDIEAITKEY